MPSHHRPLVSFTLLGFNQERFIREAIVGAFSQTYSPLEILLSDDCSTDRTFAIMQEMAAAYKGSHTIILNRNDKNLGCGNHVSAVMQAARGELIVRADGDDISVPQRAEILTEAWLRADRPAGIGSRVIAIDERGDELCLECQTFSPADLDGRVIAAPQLVSLCLEEKPLGILGGCAAWAKDNWNFFGEFFEGVQQEDTVLSFRGFLRGGLCMVDQQLVKYRAHQQSFTFSLGFRTAEPAALSTYKNQACRVAHSAKLRYALFMTVRRDLATAQTELRLDPHLLSRLTDELTRRIGSLRTQKEWWRIPCLKRLQYWSDSPYREWRQRLPSLLGINAFVLIRYVVVKAKELYVAAMRRSRP